MEKLGLLFKEASETIIRNRLQESNAVFIVRYAGVSSPEMSSLRQSMRDVDAKFFVVRNSIARRALKSSKLEVLINFLEGPCAMVFVKDHPVEASKQLFNFAKGHEKLQLAGGLLGEKVIEKKDIESMAKLPPKNILCAQVVMALNAPIAGFVRVLNGALEKFVICLDQIKKKKTS